jgi:hypothetical protein
MAAAIAWPLVAHVVPHSPFNHRHQAFCCCLQDYISSGLFLVVAHLCQNLPINLSSASQLRAPSNDVSMNPSAAHASWCCHCHHVQSRSSRALIHPHHQTCCTLTNNSCKLQLGPEGHEGHCSALAKACHHNPMAGNACSNLLLHQLLHISDTSMAAAAAAQPLFASTLTNIQQAGRHQCTG